MRARLEETRHLFNLYVCLERDYRKAENRAVHALQRKVSCASSSTMQSECCRYIMDVIRGDREG